MAGNVNDVAQRIMSIRWDGSLDRQASRSRLMQEYLRRSAWWGLATGQSEWLPFFDIAAAVDPGVRADQTVVDQVSAYLSKNYQVGLVRRACVNALHFAALLDAGIPLPEAPEQPFEPLLMLLERGDGFHIEGGGLIQVDTLGIRIGELEDNLRAEPWVQLDAASLDALDAARTDRW
jgi:hypothetical protein